jgi:uncharacterized protein
MRALTAEVEHGAEVAGDNVQPSVAARVLVTPIRFYQRFIGPLIPPSCRFTPSCSEYAVQALRAHGAVRGVWLTVRRLLRCAPWHPGGWDPVPPPRRQPAAGRTTDADTTDATAEEIF